LSGELRETFPAEYEMYTTVRDWQNPDKTYLDHLDDLLRTLYKAPENAFDDIWSEFFQEFPSTSSEHRLLTRGLSVGAVKSHLAEEEKRVVPDREAHDADGIKMLSGYANISRMDKESHTWHLPRQDNVFIGREELLGTLGEDWGTAQVKAITAVSGLGGVGKTQLALRYSHLSKHFPWRIWFSAENEARLQADFAAFAKDFGLCDEKAGPETIKALALRWFAQHPGCLVVFDNVPSLAVISEYLPDKGTRTLITSRCDDWPGNFSRMLVDTMPLGDARALIKELTGEAGDAVDVLIARLGSLPLALAQAGAYIHCNPITVTAYLSLYDEYYQVLLSGDSMPAGTDHVAVAVTWDISLSAIEKAAELKGKHSHARALLTVCSYLASEQIPLSLLGRWMESLDLAMPAKLALLDAVRELSNQSLLKVDVERGTLDVHRLVQTVIRMEHQGQDDEKRSGYLPVCTSEWYKQLMEHAHEEFALETTPLEDEAREKALLPHLETLCEHHRDYPESKHPNGEVGILLRDQGFVWQTLGNAQRARAKHKEALSELEGVYGADHWQVAMTLRNLAIAVGYLGDAASARRMYERALKIEEAHYGKDHSQVAITLTNLATVVGALGDAAENHIRQRKSSDKWQYLSANCVLPTPPRPDTAVIALTCAAPQSPRVASNSALPINTLSWRGRCHVRLFLSTTAIRE